MDKIKAAVVGATGYTGSELIRILHNHPEVEISLVTSESKSGLSIPDIHPAYHSVIEHVLRPMEEIKDHDIDIAFLGLPHGVAMDFVKQYSDAPFKIIDLSGDFRLNSQAEYKSWYGMEHVYPEGIDKAVFGLPEVYRKEISTARLIANPGCYPTSAILGIYPLLSKRLIDPVDIIVDSKSGVTGAGVKPKPVTHFSNVNDNFKSYGLKTHRHTIEIQRVLDNLTGTNPLIQFTPHLLPIDRGILSTIYVRPSEEINDEQLLEVYKEFYAPHPFIRITDTPPSVKGVRGSNYCDIYCTHDERTGRIIILSAIDNLVKGASGQAVQNMNIMFNFDETAGLNLLPLNP